MTIYSKYFLKILHKVFSLSTNYKRTELINDNDPNSISLKIRSLLNSKHPSMIARFGANELNVILNFKGITNGRNLKAYLKGETYQWWWNESSIELFHRNAGFFPPTNDNINKYCKLAFSDMKELNILGSWLLGERLLKEELEEVEKVRLLYLDPFWAKIPWTKALEGKKVLVIHPFEATIRKQYDQRHLLFDNNLLPDFELKTIKAVQSIAGTVTPFINWFEALDHMKEQMDGIDYDICLIGAGAYGFHLAAHAKRMGKKGFHLGGSLQLLFGIRGRRWENNYNKDHDYSSLINEHWVRPGMDERPSGANGVENACYW